MFATGGARGETPSLDRRRERRGAAAAVAAGASEDSVGSAETFSCTVDVSLVGGCSSTVWTFSLLDTASDGQASGD